MQKVTGNLVGNYMQRVATHTNMSPMYQHVTDVPTLVTCLVTCWYVSDHSCTYQHVTKLAGEILIGALVTC